MLIVSKCKKHIEINILWVLSQKKRKFLKKIEKNVDIVVFFCYNKEKLLKKGRFCRELFN